MLERSKGAPTLKDQLLKIVEHQIQNGVYKPGQLIPREIDFQNQYKVSRITVRAVMSELELRGYVERVKGKGTIVIEQKVSEPLLKIKGFTEEMKEKGIIPTTLYANISLVKANVICAKELMIEVGTPVYELVRVKCINDRPIVMFKTYIKSYVNLELNHDVYYGSFYELLHHVHHIEVTKVKQRLTADVADELLAKELDCKKYAPLLVLKRTGFDQDGNLFEYTEGKYVASRYEYYFELEQTN